MTINYSMDVHINSPLDESDIKALQAMEEIISDYEDKNYTYTDHLQCKPHHHWNIMIVIAKLHKQLYPDVEPPFMEDLKQAFAGPKKRRRK